MGRLVQTTHEGEPIYFECGGQIVKVRVYITEQVEGLRPTKIQWIMEASNEVKIVHSRHLKPKSPSYGPYIPGLEPHPERGHAHISFEDTNLAGEGEIP